MVKTNNKEQLEGKYLDLDAHGTQDSTAVVIFFSYLNCKQTWNDFRNKRCFSLNLGKLSRPVFFSFSGKSRHQEKKRQILFARAISLIFFFFSSAD